MNIHWLQHVEFEGLGCVGPWLREQGHCVSCTRLWAGESLPAADSFDGLIVMGGPMGIYDDIPFPWLPAERAFLAESIRQNKPILGICLGAQLLADALGATVSKNEHKEIGFFPLRSVAELDLSHAWNGLQVFHWHGDTFTLPADALRLASSEATENQAFLYRDNVLALQFHLETTVESLRALYENAANEIVDAPFIQTVEAMRPHFSCLAPANELMFALLKKLF